MLEESLQDLPPSVQVQFPLPEDVASEMDAIQRDLLLIAKGDYAAVDLSTPISVSRSDVKRRNAAELLLELREQLKRTLPDVVGTKPLAQRLRENRNKEATKSKDPLHRVRTGHIEKTPLRSPLSKMRASLIARQVRAPSMAAPRQQLPAFAPELTTVTEQTTTLLHDGTGATTFQETSFGGALRLFFMQLSSLSRSD